MLPRDMFYAENGKHVRTKKEILGEDGEIREGCRIVKKGEVYEKKLFTAKDERFKSNLLRLPIPKMGFVP